ncbi:MAG TPA: ferritin family protein [Sedimentisphaerales bacterium]|nr:ferritin family protein [Sedimentisphaerales bacterium]
MPMAFNADEVFEMAEQIEVNGAKFYRAAAKKFPALSKMLRELAAMEDEHQKTFASMHAELSSGDKQTLVYDPDGQAQAYLRVMADGNVFDIKADPTDKLADCRTAQDVLRVAIGLEKDSIAFYVGIQASVSSGAGKDKVKKLISEEVKHIALLSEKLDALK